MIDEAGVERLRELAAAGVGPRPMRRGEVIAGRFAVEAPIGEGGMGVVYRALDRVSGGAVALKIVALPDDATRVRFEREAEALRDLDDPGVVRWIAHGACGEHEGFLASELLEGETLAQRLERGSLEVRDALAVVRRAAAALGSAHRAGVVHRDIKPSNIFLAGGELDRVVVLDFGLARPAGAVTVTATGAVLGTVGYLSPEQIKSSRDVDPRADVFGLGLVLFECVAGRPAFSGADTEAVLTKIALELAPRLASVAVRVAPELDALTARMLEKDPARRPADGAAVAVELARLEAVATTAEGSGTARPGAEPAVGERLAGRYQVVRRLGRGGMGVVVECRDVTLDRPVAIKVLRAGADAARLFREARAASRLASEHATRVLDFGTLPSGSPFMVMELLDGEDLAAVLRRRGRVPVSEAVDLVLQALEAVAEAHARGVVHRDLKPSNLFLTQRPDGSPLVKVLDFGISKLGEGEGAEAALTTTSAVLGSPRYMSPEQLKSPRDVDVRSDIWSVGTVLAELVGGRPAFDGATAVAVAAHIASEPPHLDAGVTEGLLRALRACLSKDPAERPHDVGALAAMLAPFGPDDAWDRARRVARIARGRHESPPAAGNTAAADAGSSAPPRTAATRARRGALAAGIPLAIAFAWWSLRGSPATPGSGSPSAPLADPDSSFRPVEEAPRAPPPAASPPPATASAASRPEPAARSHTPSGPATSPTSARAKAPVEPMPATSRRAAPAATVDPSDPALEGR